MSNLAILREVVIDNRRFVEHLTLFRRDVTVPKLTGYVSVGIRRCGKSYWLFQVMQELVEQQDASWDDIVYVNFEDERLLGFSLESFNLLLELHAERSARPPILFLDEIQNIPGWEHFARRMADQKIRTYITGSNARMLGKDVSETLGGRFFTVNMFTLSFSEFLTALGIEKTPEALLSTQQRGRIRAAFASFLSYGGFPEVATVTNGTQKLNYINTIYRTVYLGDIVARNHLEHPLALRLMLKQVAQSVGQPLSFSRLVRLVNATGCKLSKVSLMSYMQATCDACLLCPVRNYHGKLVERQTHPKYYFADNGILSLLREDPDSALLENLVAMNLLRKYGLADDVFYYEDNIEVDFYVPAKELAIQVSLRLEANVETKRREITALEKLAAYLPCRRRLILTLSEETELESPVGTIEVMPVWKWLLQETSPAED